MTSDGAANQNGDLARMQVRAAKNQSLFREVNERIEELRPHNMLIEFACECIDTDCAAALLLSDEEYEHVRRFPTHPAPRQTSRPDEGALQGRASLHRSLDGGQRLDAPLDGAALVPGEPGEDVSVAAGDTGSRRT